MVLNHEKMKAEVEAQERESAERVCRQVDARLDEIWTKPTKPIREVINFHRSVCNRLRNTYPVRVRDCEDCMKQL